MKVLVAPCSFKGSLSALAAAEAIADGLVAAGPFEPTLLPIADGGEGTLDVLLNALGGTRRSATVEDPLGRPIQARWGVLGDGRTAVLEAAQAVGLPLLGDSERNPLRASSTGLGQLLRDALDAGCETVWIGLGGSATVDGGTGMLRALGARLLDESGRELLGDGRSLGRLQDIDRSALLTASRPVRLVGLCDVQSPLLGPRGARLYMRQKGADEHACQRLSRGLERFADVAERCFGRPVRHEISSGAAGGLGAALLLLGARLVSGSTFVLDAVGAEEKIRRTDLVVSGEGRLDAQTLQGKGVAAVAALARRHQKPLVVFCGRADGDREPLRAAGVSAVYEIVTEGMDDRQAMQQAPELLRAATRRWGERARSGSGGFDSSSELRPYSDGFPRPTDESAFSPSP